MVSLPPIFSHEGNFKFSIGSEESKRLSTTRSLPFCNECTEELGLPDCTINSHILQQYRNKCAQIRNVSRSFFDNQNKILSENSSLKQESLSFISKTSSKKSVSDFQLIDLSKLQPLDSTSNWNRRILDEKISKNRKICQLTPMKLKREKYKQHKCKPRQLLVVEKGYDESKLKTSLADSHHSKSKPVLSAYPQVIMFQNFKVGRLYKRYCKITNESSKKCTFIVSPVNMDPQINVDYNPGMNTLAAGLSTQLTITFKCSSMVDAQEEVVVTVRGKEELKIYVLVSSSPIVVEYTNKAYNIESEFGDETSIVSLIDCGSHFVGEHNKVSINLKNTGSSARFCFLGETDWYSMEVSLDSSNTLIVGDGLFTITPMYFSLGKGQTIEISVTCYPPSAGFHNDQMLLLCDNTAVKRLDLECDGFLFDMSWIQFQGMLKMFSVDTVDEDSTEYYIDMGIASTSSKLPYPFELYHNGFVNVSYHWEVRPSKILGRKSLPLSALKVIPSSGRLFHKTQKTFNLQCDTTSLQPATYRAMLVLVVDDLQEKCIPIEIRDKLLPINSEDERGLRSIEVKSIEVWLEVVIPHVILVPYEIEFSESPLILGSPRETWCLYIGNKGPGTVKLTWICEEDNPFVELNIDPKQIECEECSCTCCVLTAKALQEGKFITTCWCVSENRDYGFKLQVKGTCCKAELILITNSVDFGGVKRWSQKMEQIIAQSCSTERTSRKLNELSFRACNNGLLEPSNEMKSLSANLVEFCHKDSEVFVKYQLNTEEDEMKCSVLNWEGQYVPVIADVQEADVSLSTHTLCPEVMYQGVQYTFQIFVRNHTLSNTPVFWGNSIAQERSGVTIKIDPGFAVLGPAQELITEISLTPHIVGSLQNIFIPCFVEGNLQPLLLKVEGVVSGLKVRVEWKSETKLCSVVWPPEKQAGSEDSVKYSTSLDSLICVCPPSSLDLGSVKSNESLAESEITLISKSSNSSQNSDKDNDAVSNISSIPYLNWPIIGGRYTRDPMSEDMERRFNNLFTLGNHESLKSIDELMACCPDNNLCFFDIPTRKAVTQLLYIRNDTMVSANYKVCILNNFERPSKPDETNMLERIQRKIKYKLNKDDWSERVSKDRGLTVFVEPAQGELFPQDYVIISVTVYALSWGSYTDAILIQLGQLDQLCIRLCITVSQHPIKVPPHVRFGATFQKSPDQFKFLKVENCSTVSLTVCWQIFSSGSDEFPFGAMLFDKNPFELGLTTFYGSCGSPHFKIKENYTFLKPCSSSSVEIKLIPQSCEIKLTDDEYSRVPKAVLIGYVYLTDDAKYITNTESCVRADGRRLPPLEVELEGHVELPVISLLNVFNYQLVFKCTSYDVMSTKHNIWQQEKVICVQNRSLIDLKAKITTLGYFHVSKINYPCNEDQNKKIKDVIFLHPGETCEVTICCKVTKETLLECFEEEPIILDDADIEAGIVERGLLSFEQEELTQKVNLELYLYQPLLALSAKSLNFGLVYVGDTKVLSLTLKAPIGKESFQTFISSGKSDEVFSVDVSFGVLDPKVIFPLQISFSPKENITYTDLLVVRACMDRMFWEVPISGVGTFNYKPHEY